MTVYLVIQYAASGSFVLGVFDTAEKAKAFARGKTGFSIEPHTIQ